MRPYLLRDGSDVGARARGAAERRSAEARRGQLWLGGVGGVGGVGLAAERWARGPEGLLALRQALILQHLLRAQHTPVTCPGPHWPEALQPSRAELGGFEPWRTWTPPPPELGEGKYAEGKTLASSLWVMDLGGSACGAKSACPRVWVCMMSRSGGKDRPLGIAPTAPPVPPSCRASVEPEA